MSRNAVVLIIFSIAILGSCGVFAASAFASINALGRNPSSAPKIFTTMIIALSFAWLIAVIAMLITFQLLAPA